MAVLLQARNTTAACFPLNLGPPTKVIKCKSKWVMKEKTAKHTIFKAQKALGLGGRCRSVLILSELVVHSPLHYYRPDFMLTPNFSPGFNDSRLDLYGMHVPYLPEYIQTCTDTEQREKVEKAEVPSVPGSPTSSEGSKRRWYRTLGLVTGSMHHGKLPHRLPLVPPIPCPHLQDLAQHLRQHCILY